MIKGYLYYEQEDAKSNAQFISMLQKEAEAQSIILELAFPNELYDDIESIDFVWNRTRRYEIAQYYEEKGIRVFNNSNVNKIANDKGQAIHFVETLNINTIPTWTKLHPAIPLPAVVKTTDGHGGNEVILCKSFSEIEQAIKQFDKRTCVIQTFIPSNAQDIRIWILGEKVLGAVIRTGKNDFKSNYSLGGSIEKFNIPLHLQNEAIQIAKTLNSDYIGVDFIKGEDGTFYFNEMEDPVGARSYYDLFDDQLAKQLINYIQTALSIKSLI